jgi:hypothetical protein
MGLVQYMNCKASDAHLCHVVRAASPGVSHLFLQHEGGGKAGVVAEGGGGVGSWYLYCPY